MALTNTTLAIDATIDTLTFNVTSSTGATVGGFMRIDAEWMMIVEIPIVTSSACARAATVADSRRPTMPWRS